MTDTAGEQLLTGGNSNAPVRIGDRVHRIAGPWSPTVHAYLEHLLAAGIDAVPRPFGFDDRGREVLQFLPGHVPAYPMPLEVWSERMLDDAARLLRRLHDAATDFDRAGRIWQQPARVPDETICVGDFAPYNFVLRAGRLAAVIDLDQASPGPRVRDLAHLAYRLVPLTDPANADVPLIDDGDRRARLHRLARAYGGDGPSPSAILAAVPEVLTGLVEHSTRQGLPEHAALYRRDGTWLVAVGASLIEEEP